MNAFLSIHDVMPDTLEKVMDIMGYLKNYEIHHPSLLVVPGLDWTEKQVRILQSFADRGCELIAHGWHHRCSVRRPFHRLHSALISRNVAEHLDLHRPEILDLMRRSHDWFEKHQLPAPAVYVPPAWALGSLKAEDLLQTPFSVLETQFGLRYRRSQTLSETAYLPLSGYEADTPLRESFLRTWNSVQLKISVLRTLPLRISIHPFDLELRIADQLSKHLQLVSTVYPYCRAADIL